MKKLQLKSIKVKSFITDLNIDELTTIKGGKFMADESEGVGCDSQHDNCDTIINSKGCETDTW